MGEDIGVPYNLGVLSCDCMITSFYRDVIVSETQNNMGICIC